MRANRSRDTAPELALRRLLHARGLRYRVDAQVEPNVRSRADIVFRSVRVAVFVDGCFWHRCPEHATTPRTNAHYWETKFARNIARDRRVDAELATRGWNVVRVWEHECPEDAADRVAEVVATAKQAAASASRIRDRRTPA